MRAAIDARYNRSDKGRARHRRYEWEERTTPLGTLRTRRPKAQARRERYERSDHGQFIRETYEWDARYMVNLQRRIINGSMRLAEYGRAWDEAATRDKFAQQRVKRLEHLAFCRKRKGRK